MKEVEDNIMDLCDDTEDGEHADDEDALDNDGEPPEPNCVGPPTIDTHVTNYLISPPPLYAPTVASIHTVCHARRMAGLSTHKAHDGDSNLPGLCMVVFPSADCCAPKLLMFPALVSMRLKSLFRVT